MSTAPQALAGPLQESIEAGNVESGISEIARGADVNEADMMLGLPLMIAAQKNHVAIAGLRAVFDTKKFTAERGVGRQSFHG